MGKLRQKEVTIVITTIIIFSMCLVKAEDQTQLPSDHQIQRYVSNLIENYNNMIKFYEMNDPHFEYNKKHFSLYHEVGYSFQVIATKSDKDDNRFISLIFKSIFSNSPIISTDFEHDWNDYFPGISAKGYMSFIEGNFIEFGGRKLYTDFTICLTSDQVLDNTLENSDKMAEYVYKRDKINPIWKPFLEENDEVISESDLNNRVYEMQMKIYSDESYTYESFLEDFKSLNLTVTHYKQRPIMIEKWNDFVNSEGIKDFEPKKNLEIPNKTQEIKNNILSNESYLLVDFESNLRDLNQTIHEEIESRKWGNKPPIKNLKKIINWFYSIIIPIGTIGGLWVFVDIYRFLKERNEKKTLFSYFRKDIEKIKKIVENLISMFSRKLGIKKSQNKREEM